MTDRSSDSYPRLGSNFGRNDLRARISPYDKISKERLTMKKTIIFLHGKQSTPEGSGSGKAIREHFSNEHNVLIPDYKPMKRTHEEIDAYLKDYISPHPEALIVGISLGGYWAYRMTCVLPANLGLSCVLLNPYFTTIPRSKSQCRQQTSRSPSSSTSTTTSSTRKK